MKHLVTLVLGGAILLGAAGCGDDDDDDAVDSSDTTEERSEDDASDDADDYADAIAEGLLQADLGLDATSASCLGEAMVDAVGVEAFRDADITTTKVAAANSLSDVGIEIPADTATKVSDALGTCDAVPGIRTAVVDTFVQELGTPLPPDAVTCIEQAFTDDAVTQASTAALVDGDGQPISAALLATIPQCPQVSMTLLLAGSPPPTDDEKACVIAFLQERRELVSAAFETNDAAAQSNLGVELAGVCPDAFL
jgi:hypothetical protein